MIRPFHDNPHNVRDLTVSFTMHVFLVNQSFIQNFEEDQSLFGDT